MHYKINEHHTRIAFLIKKREKLKQFLNMFHRERFSYDV